MAINKKIIFAGLVTLLVGVCPVFGVTSKGIEQYNDVQDDQAYNVSITFDKKQEAMTGADIALSGAKGCAKLAAAAIMGGGTLLIMQNENAGYEGSLVYAWGTFLAGLSAYDELVYFKKSIFNDYIGDDEDINSIKNKNGSIIRAIGSGLTALDLGLYEGWRLLADPNLNNAFGMAIRMSVLWSAYLAWHDACKNW